MFCNTFLRHLDVMIAIQFNFWYHVNYDGSKTSQHVYSELPRPTQSLDIMASWE